MINDLEDDFALAAAKGAHMAACRHDQNLTIFAGRFKSAKGKHSQDRFSKQYNAVYSYPTRKNVDALIISVGTIFHFFSEKAIDDFLESFESIPTVTIAGQYPGRSSVVFDGSSGLSDVLEHLIIDHGYKKIGFIAGPVGNYDSEERVRIYRSVLEKHGIEVKQEYITHGDYSDYDVEPIDRFVDKYSGELEAICCANDAMAGVVYRALERNGLEPGKDVAVTGYDNSVAASAMEPGLTTVSANAAELGFRAFEECLQMISSGRTHDIILRSESVIRQSCGCRLSFDDASESMLPKFRQRFDEDIETILESPKDAQDIFAIEDFPAEDTFEFVRRTVSAAEGDSDETGDSLTKFFREKLLSRARDTESINTVTDFAAAVCRTAFRKAKNEQTRQKVTRLQFKIISAINGAMSAANYSLLRGTRAAAMFLTNIVSAVGSSEREKYGDMLLQINRLGIPGAYFYLLDEPQKITNPFEDYVFERFNLTAYNRGADCFCFNQGDVSITRDTMLSNQFISSRERHTLAISPLFSTSEHYGLLLLDLPPEQFANVQAISRQVSTVIESDMMLSRANYMLDEEQAMNENLRRIATRDALTGIYNRRGFFDVVEKVVHHSENSGRRSVMVFADMDDLKYINDNFSHEDGDRALKLVGAALIESFGESGIIGRIGGDEFVAFASLDENGSAEEVYTLVKSVMRRHSDGFAMPYAVSVSVGAVDFRCSPELDVEDIIDRADRLLYIDKQKKTPRQ